jgi:hypothetical protein
MRLLKRIFLSIFFSGILYTVFNYLPLIEEEVCSKKIEQTTQQDNSDGGEGGKDDSQKAQEDLFRGEGPAVLIYGYLDASYRRYLHKIYIPPLQELNTPPPRQAA